MLTEALVSIVAPGATMWRRRRWSAVGCLALGLVAPLGMLAYTLASGRNWVALSLDTNYLGWLIAVLVGAVVARLAALPLSQGCSRILARRQCDPRHCCQGVFDRLTRSRHTDASLTGPLIRPLFVPFQRAVGRAFEKR